MGGNGNRICNDLIAVTRAELAGREVTPHLESLFLLEATALMAQAADARATIRQHVALSQCNGEQCPLSCACVANCASHRCTLGEYEAKLLERTQKCVQIGDQCRVVVPEFLDERLVRALWKAFACEANGVRDPVTFSVDGVTPEAERRVHDSMREILESISDFGASKGQNIALWLSVRTATGGVPAFPLNSHDVRFPFRLGYCLPSSIRLLVHGAEPELVSAVEQGLGESEPSRAFTSVSHTAVYRNVAQLSCVPAQQEQWNMSADTALRAAEQRLFQMLGRRSSSQFAAFVMPLRGQKGRPLAAWFILKDGGFEPDDLPGLLSLHHDAGAIFESQMGIRYPVELARLLAEKVMANGFTHARMNQEWKALHAAFDQNESAPEVVDSANSSLLAELSKLPPDVATVSADKWPEALRKRLGGLHLSAVEGAARRRLLVALHRHLGRKAAELDNRRRVELEQVQGQVRSIVANATRIAESAEILSMQINENIAREVTRLAGAGQTWFAQWNSGGQGVTLNHQWVDGTDCKVQAAGAYLSATGVTCDPNGNTIERVWRSSAFSPIWDGNGDWRDFFYFMKWACYRPFKNKGITGPMLALLLRDVQGAEALRKTTWVAKLTGPATPAEGAEPWQEAVSSLVFYFSENDSTKCLKTQQPEGSLLVCLRPGLRDGDPTRLFEKVANGEAGNKVRFIRAATWWRADAPVRKGNGTYTFDGGSVGFNDTNVQICWRATIEDDGLFER